MGLQTLGDGGEGVAEPHGSQGGRLPPGEGASRTTDRARRPAWFRPTPHIAIAPFAVWLAAALLGALHASAAVFGHALNLDGVSYLDLAERAASDPRSVLNGYWSPLYPLILAGPLALVGAGGIRELYVVHGVNFAVFLAALFAFRSLWRELGLHVGWAGATAALGSNDGPGPGRARVAEGRHAGSDAGERLADDGSRSAEAGQGAAWPVLGGLLFVWGTLGLINVWAITPDLLVAVFVFAAFRYLLRIRRGQGGVRAFLGLGLALGIGYWAKAAMFVLAPTFLLAAWLLASPGVRTRRTLLAGGAFLVLALPLLGSLTIAKGRVTFGDSGRLNVWWYGNGRPQILWREPAAVHPPRVLLSEPLTYAYDDGPGGTYPLWFDPSYWQEGSSPTLDATAIGRAVAANGWHLWGRVFLPLLPALVVGLMAPLLWSGPGPRGPPPGGPPVWPLWIPVAAGLSLTVPVYSETRYVAPFAVTLMALLAVRAWAPRRAGGLHTLVVAAFLGPLALEVGARHLEEGFPLLAGSTLEAVRTPGAATGYGGPAPVMHDPVRVADAMRRAGIPEGARVAVVGPGWAESRWARLARVRIVAEVAPVGQDAFWAEVAARQRTIGALRATSIYAVVGAPGGRSARHPPDGWSRVGRTGYLIHRLAPESQFHEIKPR